MAELCHRGRLLHTTTLHRGRTRETFVQELEGGQDPKTKIVQKMEGPATTQPSPPLSNGDSQPQGRRWCRCSQSCEIATLPHPPSPTSPLLPPHHPHLFQDQPHFHRRSICPGQRLDTSLETITTKVPKYADNRDLNLFESSSRGGAKTKKPLLHIYFQSLGVLRGRKLHTY